MLRPPGGETGLGLPGSVRGPEGFIVNLAQRSHRSAFQFDCSFDPGQNDSMGDARGRRNLPSRWTGVEETLPASLSHLAGPPGGVVELPHDLAWSGRRSFDLANPVQRYIYHMTVLTSGVTREHYTSWLNVDLLRSEWTSLGLPLPLRRVWEGHFPELASVRAESD